MESEQTFTLRTLVSSYFTAIHDATGVWLNELPLMPEQVRKKHVR